MITVAYGSPGAMLSMSYHSDCPLGPRRSVQILSSLLFYDRLYIRCHCPNCSSTTLLSSPLVPLFASSAQTTFHFRKLRCSPGSSFDLTYDSSCLFELLLTPSWHNYLWPFQIHLGFSWESPTCLYCCELMWSDTIRWSGFAITETSALAVNFNVLSVCSRLHK